MSWKALFLVGCLSLTACSSPSSKTDSLVASVSSSTNGLQNEMLPLARRSWLKIRGTMAPTFYANPASPIPLPNMAVAVVQPTQTSSTVLHLIWKDSHYVSS